MLANTTASALEFRSYAELQDANMDVTSYGFGFAVSCRLVSERPIAKSLVHRTPGSSRIIGDAGLGRVLAFFPT